MYCSEVQPSNEVEPTESNEVNILNSLNDTRDVFPVNNELLRSSLVLSERTDKTSSNVTIPSPSLSTSLLEPVLADG